jgi:sigma-B regulation protein RsbU (phosphoserine phosphatase)
MQAVLNAPLRAGLTESEKDEARQIQLSLLPEESLKGPTFEIAYRFLPYAEVGGDFADFFCMPDGHVGIYIGDVVGKGLSAAMYAALVMGMIRGIHKTGTDTADALSLLNKRLLVRPVSGRYSATLYAVFDPVSLKLIFSNAGLPYPLLVTKTGCRQLGEGGLPSGLLLDSTYDLHCVQLAPGDAVLFATDGLHELRDRENQDFSWTRLTEIWHQCWAMPAEASLDFLFHRAREFAEGGRQHDDITTVVLKIPH